MTHATAAIRMALPAETTGGYQHNDDVEYCNRKLQRVDRIKDKNADCEHAR
jgi:hypothetical protein